jgi:hypothetical protein
MPTELVWLGGLLVVVVGVLAFFLIRRHRPDDLPHLR